MGSEDGEIFDRMNTRPCTCSEKFRGIKMENGDEMRSCNVRGSLDFVDFRRFSYFTVCIRTRVRTYRRLLINFNSKRVFKLSLIKHHEMFFFLFFFITCKLQVRFCLLHIRRCVM